MQVPNLYQILGVSRKMADESEGFADQLCEAYLERAAPYHQIVTNQAPGQADEHAAGMFEVLTDAYTILQDPEQRLEYHHYLDGTKTIDLIAPKPELHRSSDGSEDVIARSFAEMADIERQIGGITGFE